MIRRNGWIAGMAVVALTPVSACFAAKEIAGTQVDILVYLPAKVIYLQDAILPKDVQPIGGIDDGCPRTTDGVVCAPAASVQSRSITSSTPPTDGVRTEIPGSDFSPLVIPASGSKPFAQSVENLVKTARLYTEARAILALSSNTYQRALENGVLPKYSQYPLTISIFLRPPSGAGSTCGTSSNFVDGTATITTRPDQQHPNAPPVLTIKLGPPSRASNPPLTDPQLQALKMAELRAQSKLYTLAQEVLAVSECQHIQ